MWPSIFGPRAEKPCVHVHGFDLLAFGIRPHGVQTFGVSFFCIWDFGVEPLTVGPSLHYRAVYRRLCVYLLNFLNGLQFFSSIVLFILALNLCSSIVVGTVEMPYVQRVDKRPNSKQPKYQMPRGQEFDICTNTFPAALW